MPKKPDWAAFYDKTKHSPPSKLLVRALEHARQKEKAIDIGGGALKDSRYLLAQGFEVTVIDKSELLTQAVAEFQSDRLRAVVSAFADFSFPERTYDLATAMFSLPFNPPETFNRVFDGIKKSLNKDGIFCGNFFGMDDDWSKSPAMTFHSKEQVETLLRGMEIIFLNERQWDGKLTDGTPKHWHVFDVIARAIK